MDFGEVSIEGVGVTAESFSSRALPREVVDGGALNAWDVCYPSPCLNFRT